VEISSSPSIWLTAASRTGPFSHFQSSFHFTPHRKNTCPNEHLALHKFHHHNPSCKLGKGLMSKLILLEYESYQDFSGLHELFAAMQYLFLTSNLRVVK